MGTYYNINDNDRYIVFFRIRNNDWWYFISGESTRQCAVSSVRSHEERYNPETHLPLEIIKNVEILKKYDYCHIHTFLSHNYAMLNNNTFNSIKESDNYVIYNKYKSNATKYYFIESASTKKGAEHALCALMRHEERCGRNGSEIYEYCSIQHLLMYFLYAERDEYMDAYKI